MLDLHSESEFNPVIQDFNGEPRLGDVRLHQWLRFDCADWQEFMDLHIDALRCLGNLVVVNCDAKAAKRKLRPQQFWLTEKQAVYLCARSRSREADRTPDAVPRAFAIWHASPRARQTVPLPKASIEAAKNISSVREARRDKGNEAAAQLYGSLPLPSHLLMDLAWENCPIVMVLQERCVITGDLSDWVNLDDLFDEYYVIMQDLPVPDPDWTSFCARLHSLSESYTCPLTGNKFSTDRIPAVGYAGIRRIAPDTGS